MATSFGFDADLTGTGPRGAPPLVGGTTPRDELRQVTNVDASYYDNIGEPLASNAYEYDAAPLQPTVVHTSHSGGGGGGGLHGDDGGVLVGGGGGGRGGFGLDREFGPTAGRAFYTRCFLSA